MGDGHSREVGRGYKTLEAHRLLLLIPTESALPCPLIQDMWFTLSLEQICAQGLVGSGLPAS